MMILNKVLTFGELMMRLTPDNKRLNQAKEFKAYYGGAEANVAMALGMFDHESVFLSALPTNDIGNAAVSQLASSGVDTSWVFREEGRLGVYYYEKGYSLKQAKVIYDRNHSTVHHLPEKEIDWERIYKDVDILHTSGITPALSKEMKKFTLTAVAEAKKNNVIVSFDFNYRGKLWTVGEAKDTFLDILPFVDICFAGYKDFIHILDEQGPETFDESLLKEFYESYAEKYNVTVFASTKRQAFSATNNSLQAYFYKNKKMSVSEAYTFEILERIGSGDAFAAGILHGILCGMQPEKTVEFGVASGVLKHMVEDDHNRYTVDDINSFLNNRGIDVNR